MRPAPSFKNEVFWRSLSSSDSRKRLKVGWVKDAHGLKGELYVQLHAKKADWLSTFREFWLEKDAAFEHFTVTRAQPHRDGLIVKPDNLQDRTQAERLKGRPFFIPEDYLQARPGEDIFLHQILGFQVFDGEREVGRIEAFSTNGAQDLLNVRRGDKEFFVPLVAAFIREIDHEGRRLIMELPPGLEGEE